MLYKVTYDFVEIPTAQYLTHNTRLSRHRHPLSYRQIPTLKDYYRFTFFPMVNYSSGCPASPHTSPSHLGAAQQCCLPGDPCLSLNTMQFLILPFNYTNTLFTMYKLIQGSRSPKFGAEIRPHSQCQKVCFFPNSR